MQGSENPKDRTSLRASSNTGQSVKILCFLCMLCVFCASVSAQGSTQGQTSVNVKQNVQENVQEVLRESKELRIMDVYVPNIIYGGGFLAQATIVNTGNMALQPEIYITLLDAEGDEMRGRFGRTFPLLSPGQTTKGMIPQDVDLLPGEYTAKIELLAEGMTFRIESVKFFVVLDDIRKADIEEFKVSAGREDGENYFLITTVFRNPSSSRINATLVSEVSQRSTVILRSQQETIDPFSKRIMTNKFYSANMYGYDIRSYVIFTPEGSNETMRTDYVSTSMNKGLEGDIRLGVGYATLFIILLTLVILVRHIKRKKDNTV